MILSVILFHLFGNPSDIYIRFKISYIFNMIADIILPDIQYLISRYQISDILNLISYHFEGSDSEEYSCMVTSTTRVEKLVIFFITIIIILIISSSSSSCMVTSTSRVEKLEIFFNLAFRKIWHDIILSQTSFQEITLIEITMAICFPKIPIEMTMMKIRNDNNICFRCECIRTISWSWKEE